MSKIVILCEGKTEELAVRHLVARQWKADNLAAVGLSTINLRAKVKDAGKSARVELDKKEVVAVFTLIDLYGMKQVTHPSNDALEQKVERVREWLRAQIDHPRADRFFPHVSVHETEAWILAEGHALAARLKDTSIKPDPNAESKNFQRPPSTRLNELFQRRRQQPYHKRLLTAPLC
ncbi:MAG TPA: DUF4276 family protein [Terriglobia bacterium]|nr:DUF4276 family protein [Terriglobia bacterium]